MEPVKNKKQMYKILAQGGFGNCVKQYNSLEEFQQSGYDRLVGIRSLRRGGLFIPYVKPEDVKTHLNKFPEGYNISPMQDDKRIRVQGELFRDESGLRLFCSFVQEPMRAALKKGGQQYSNLEALRILKRNFWPSSYDDIMELLDDYDGHVVEFSCYSIPVGSLPHRNVIIWEVRQY